ncbi:capsule biosynthesis protein [Jannaschia seohaensis]|uniref:Capsular polysaccharide transport system permease protein n=1 Tax=Jannaschia seohaensis TaxID=475081 RepID=A0A2Y9ANQ0_9RHOB|nr:capsule biosynthesis protein [Jannaschia seohaensis]PWJ19088.1 capsular polysaccharide transport system permease protein [Jannaschia seohaensis]SSA45706.1 capsular polysaccharide transport system permease protein [Jannaschia seohaensis]
MTPRALKYRIRPDTSYAPAGIELPKDATPPTEPTVLAPPANDPAPAEGEPTGRQLRLARRIAQKHGLEVSSDREAVEALRARGIDPFSRANMLQLVPGQGEEASVPALAPEAPPPAEPVVLDGDRRASEIVKIQRDIARRRKRRLALLGMRLAFFVGLPTLIAGIYFYVLATPMYATKSEFVIQQADLAAGGGAGLGGLFSGTGFATQTDSIAVQGYLLSREAFQRLDAELGFSAHFADPNIDALQRLDSGSSREDAYELYQRMVEIGYDPTEGVIKMEVVAADPQISAEFSRALIGYAEEQVDQLTARLRSDQMEGAIESFQAAEARMLAAQARVVDLQEQLGVVSADAELSNRYTQISAIETELRAERLRLDQLLANPRPNAARVELAENNIANLNAELEMLRDGLTDGVNADVSLARISAELGVAQMDLQTRQLLLQQAAQQQETARIEANRQVRYLSTPVAPLAPDEATYPRSFENTLLAFLIFSGIYLMVSLTAAILREQVSG